MPETKRPRYRVHIEVEDMERGEDVVSEYFQSSSLDSVAARLEDAAGEVEDYEIELEEAERAEPEPDEGVGPVCWCEGCFRERVQVDFRKPRQLCRTCTEDEAAGVALPMGA